VGYRDKLPPMEELLQRLNSVLDKRNEWERRFVDLAMKNPLESVLLMILASSFIFFRSEAGRNPKVNTFWDAVNFISTCASVGYTDIYAFTQEGKIISSVVMTFGPALCAKAFDRADSKYSSMADTDAIVQRLDAILSEMKQLRAQA
jgi:hypothetical protein